MNIRVSFHWIKHSSKMLHFVFLGSHLGTFPTSPQLCSLVRCLAFCQESSIPTDDHAPESAIIPVNRSAIEPWQCRHGKPSDRSRGGRVLLSSSSLSPALNKPNRTQLAARSASSSLSCREAFPVPQQLTLHAGVPRPRPLHSGHDAGRSSGLNFKDFHGSPISPGYFR